MQPIVSVVMSTHNREKFLTEAIQSILNQSFENFEFIIIDDASTDNTKEILNSFKDKRLRIYRNKINCGCTFNYHKAQNLAQGQFIAHIDDDDIWYERKLEKQIEFLNNHQEIVLVGSFIETFGETALKSWVFDSDSDKIGFMMNFYNPICHSAIVYRKSFVLEKGINYDIGKKCSQDYDLYSQIVQNGGKISNLAEILVKYRMHKNRITDIKETQDIQVYNANNIKQELLNRFLNKEQIHNVNELMMGFPFGEYETEKVLEGIEVAGSIYCEKYGISRNIIENVKQDIQNGIYRF